MALSEAWKELVNRHVEVQPIQGFGWAEYRIDLPPRYIDPPPHFEVLIENIISTSSCHFGFNGRILQVETENLSHKLVTAFSHIEGLARPADRSDFVLYIGDTYATLNSLNHEVPPLLSEITKPGRPYFVGYGLISEVNQE